MHTHANHYAQQQQQLRRDEWRSRPDGSLSMHVQVDGIEFNHRNDRPFFFGARGTGYMNGLWRQGALWLMPREEERENLWRKTRENHPCHKCERLEKRRVVVLFLNLATPYPLYHLIPVRKSLYLFSSNKMVLFITPWRFCHQWPTVLLNETLELSFRELLRWNAACTLSTMFLFIDSFVCLLNHALLRMLIYLSRHRSRFATQHAGKW